MKSAEPFEALPFFVPAVMMGLRGRQLAVVGNRISEVSAPDPKVSGTLGCYFESLSGAVLTDPEFDRFHDHAALIGFRPMSGKVCLCCGPKKRCLPIYY